MSIKAVAESTGNAALYAYRHVSTNQVLYSLTEALTPSALRQLPDLGANRTPATVRRDVWRPFFTVHFGPHDSASVEAQHAYERLLAWRRLHEVSWTPSPELALSYTEEQVKTIKDDLADRGGSKIDTAYDLIKKHKKNIKIRSIMDQKANSVADLAAVLLEQQRLRANQAHEQRAFRRHQSAEIQRLVELSKSPEHIRSLEQQMEAIRTTIESQSWEDSPEVTRLKKQIRALESRVLVIQKRGRGKAPVEELAQAQAKLHELKPQTKAGLKRELEDLERQRKTLEIAVPVLEKYNFSRMLQKEIIRRLRLEMGADVKNEEISSVGRGRLEELKAFLRCQQYSGFPEDIRPWAIPKTLAGPKKPPPVYGRAVNVEWEHKPDRSYAAEWPGSVSHVTRRQTPDQKALRRQEAARARWLAWEKEVVRECKAKRTEKTQSSTAEA